MKIGIDATLLEIRGGRHGIGSYLRGLIPALPQAPAHEYSLFVYRTSGLAASLPSGRFREVRLPCPPLGRAAALAAHQVALPILARRHGLDLVHVPGVAVNASMPSIPLARTIPVVVT